MVVFFWNKNYDVKKQYEHFYVCVHHGPV